MILLKKPNINDAPWKILFSAMFLSFIGLIALNSIVYSFLIIRRLDTMGYRLQPNRDDWKYSCIYLGLFISFFAVPIGFLTDFIHQTTEWLPLWQFPIILLGIFLFTGLPEELLFRGLIHNLLATRFKNKSPLFILFFSSIIFGFAHINNNDPPFIYIFICLVMSFLFLGRISFYQV